MECPECEEEMGDVVDSTYSNISTKRASIGQHTGDIYRCEKCDEKYIDDFLSKKIYPWRG